MELICFVFEGKGDVSVFLGRRSAVWRSRFKIGKIFQGFLTHYLPSAGNYEIKFK